MLLRSSFKESLFLSALCFFLLTSSARGEGCKQNLSKRIPSYSSREFPHNSGSKYRAPYSTWAKNEANAVVRAIQQGEDLRSIVLQIAKSRREFQKENGFKKIEEFGYLRRDRRFGTYLSTIFDFELPSLRGLIWKMKTSKKV